MTAPLQYVEAVARETSSRSLSGSQSSELARLTLEVTAELHEVRDQLDRHHRYLAGLTGHDACTLCAAEGVPA